MHNLQSLFVGSPTSVTGGFRLRDASYHETKVGYPYLRLYLEDMSGYLPAYAWQENIYRGLCLPNYSLIQIEGQTRYFGNELRVDLKAIAPESMKRVGDVVRLIPKSVCPLPWLLPTLQSVVNRITIPALHSFVESVLADDGISFAFVSVPASLNHHHNYPGGLLMHSLDCVSMVEKHREFDRDSYELGIVAALFHDIGKILTMTYDMQRTSLGHSLNHNKLNLEVLTPYLKRLEHDWPEGATELRYLLTWKLNRRVPSYNMADLVTCCDRISSGLDMQKRA